MKKNIAYEVPVLLVSSKAGVATEEVTVTIKPLPKTLNQRDGQRPMCLAYIEGSTYAITAHALRERPPLWGLKIYTNYFGITNDKRQLQESTRDLETPKFKFNAVAVERVWEALYLFGYLTRTQYRAALKERQTFIQKEWKEEAEAKAEADLDYLVGSKELPLAKAKKLIDQWVKEERVAEKTANLASD